MLGFGKNKAKQKTTQNSIEVTNVPTHIAIIPDGNRRWAKLHHVPTQVGHREGAYTFKRMVKAADRYGVKYITFYAFSTENWSREQTEVDALMDLLLNYLRDKNQLAGKNVKIKVIGERNRLSDEINKEIDVVEEYTKNNTGMVLYLAINYGGRQEIVNSVKNLMQKVENGELSADDITENHISDYIYTSEVPDADLIIRPSGEQRLSNFLLWQSAYSEFWYSDINWPDFTTSDFARAILDYQNRNRRFGGV